MDSVNSKSLTLPRMGIKKSDSETTPFPSRKSSNDTKKALFSTPKPIKFKVSSMRKLFRRTSVKDNGRLSLPASTEDVSDFRCDLEDVDGTDLPDSGDENVVDSTVFLTPSSSFRHETVNDLTLIEEPKSIVIVDWEKRFRDLSEKLDESERKATSLLNENSALKNESSHLREDFSNLKEKYTVSKSLCRELQAKCVKTEENLSRYIAASDTLRKEVEHLRVELSEAQTKESELVRQCEEEKRRFINEMSEVEERNSELVTNLNQKISELDRQVRAASRPSTISRPHRLPQVSKRPLTVPEPFSFVVRDEQRRAGMSHTERPRFAVQLVESTTRGMIAISTEK